MKKGAGPNNQKGRRLFIISRYSKQEKAPVINNMQWPIIIAYKTDPINYINLGIIPLAEAAILIPLKVIVCPIEVES